ncbi:hypothetical protein QFZ23_002224 [Arthrobacter globiformis]|nr:hypothetical protein [Arthrobacter globiformis]
MQGERPFWFGGGMLASDLKLGALREEWTDSPHLATEAAAEMERLRAQQTQGLQNRARERNTFSKCVGGVHPQRNSAG